MAAGELTTDEASAAASVIEMHRRAIETTEIELRLQTDIHQIAAGSFANLPRFRVLGNPAPLARAVDGDGTSRRHAER